MTYFGLFGAPGFVFCDRVQDVIWLVLDLLSTFWSAFLKRGARHVIAYSHRGVDGM